MRIFLCAVLCFCLFRPGAYALEDKSREIAQELALNEAQSDTGTAAPALRQQLGKVVAVKEEEDLNSELDSYARFMPSAGASSQSGRVSSIESASEYSYDFKVFGKLPVEFGIATRFIGLDNTTAVKLPAHLNAVSAGAQATLPFFFDKTYFTAGLVPSFLSDDWDFHSSSFHLMQRYFAIYQPNEKWTFVCGVGIFPHYEDWIWPIAGFIYKPNDRLTFNIVPKRPEISYDISEKLTVFGEGDISSNEFKVTKDNVKNAVLQYNEMHAGLGLRYRPNKYINTSLSAGSVFNRSLKYRDSLGKVVLKNGLYTEFRVDISM